MKVIDGAPLGEPGSRADAEQPKCGVGQKQACGRMHHGLRTIKRICRSIPQWIETFNAVDRTSFNYKEENRRAVAGVPGVNTKLAVTVVVVNRTGPDTLLLRLS